MNKQINIILIILFIAITFEFFFEDILFQKSLSIEKTLQTNLNFSIKFFKKISKLGDVLGHSVLFMIVYLSFPLNYIYTYAISQIFTLYLTSIIKLIHADGRPYFEDNSLFQTCNGDFGNPSGHSLSSMACYLGLSKMIIDYNKMSLSNSILVYICSIVCILIINFSRIILGAHSIDQVIYGDILGFLLYYLIFHNLYLHKRNTKEFFHNFIGATHCAKEGIFWFLCFVAIIITGLFFPLKSIEYLQRYENVIIRLCPNLPKYKMLINECIFNSLIIFEYLGMIIGLMLLGYLCNEKYPDKWDEINLFNKNNKVIYSKYLLLAISVSPLIIYGFIPQNSEMIIIYIFKVSVPLLFFAFLCFGLNLYLYIKFGFANQNIYNNESIIKNSNNIEKEDNAYYYMEN